VALLASCRLAALVLLLLICRVLGVPDQSRASTVLLRSGVNSDVIMRSRVGTVEERCEATVVVRCERWLWVARGVIADKGLYRFVSVMSHQIMSSSMYHPAYFFAPFQYLNCTRFSRVSARLLFHPHVESI
jgi:hypothetical protein